MALDDPLVVLAHLDAAKGVPLETIDWRLFDVPIETFFKNGSVTMHCILHEHDELDLLKNHAIIEKVFLASKDKKDTTLFYRRQDGIYVHFRACGNLTNLAYASDFSKFYTRCLDSVDRETIALLFASS